ncbi:molybdopterin-dependent oxidoreductase [Rhodoferax sp.]|uniref:molybdopterin-dependent oxidoreductase n=1 Tax=Rhodoferax sp. TaxID=50421 RepID=UPI0028435EF3|nr:molybdopterin-dependent oxidoreductase [Rhodoferax sp.]MDR3369346.1 molybdopterin-dependent oxidoreductase [Rhodoferax sp.]
MNLHVYKPHPNPMHCIVIMAGLLIAGQASAADELDLAIKSGCLSCHRGAEKLIGPPYQDVAAKYTGQKDATAKLAQHIMKGTGPTGLGWMKEGKASLPFMPANATVKPEEAIRLADWVLGMKGEIPGLLTYVTQSLSVTGAVGHKLDLSIDDLRKLPAQDLHEITVVSQSQATAGQTETFKGVLLRTLLEKAVILAPGRHDLKKIIIIARASDDYAIVFSWNEIFNSALGDGVLVYFEKNGKPLAEDEGRIAMLSTQDTHLGARHVRWLNAIEVRKAID